MSRQPKMKKLFLDFCKKNGLKVEDLGFNVFGAYIPHQYFTCEPDDLITFMEYTVENHCHCGNRSRRKSADHHVRAG